MYVGKREPMDTVTIGKFAKAADIGVETIRFYERIGLIERPIQSESSSYRRYCLSIVPRIRFIKQARSVGFTLADIKSYFDLIFKKKPLTKNDSKFLMEEISKIDLKIEQLQGLKGDLKGLCSD
jgi:DNA-binding transcriptional MerR regulator